MKGAFWTFVGLFIITTVFVAPFLQYQKIKKEDDPFKNDAKILVKQLRDFSDDIDNGKIKFEKQRDEWDDRFTHRIRMLLKELDERGQHSETIENMEWQQFGVTVHPSAQIKELAAEIEKLANGLSKSESR